jgi:pimeloyl-ACP methyl ester carboxylesterase
LNNDYANEKLSAPVLIIHAVDDPMPPYHISRKIAERIPGAQFITIKDEGHLFFKHNEYVRSEINKFLPGSSGELKPIR